MTADPPNSLSEARDQLTTALRNAHRDFTNYLAALYPAARGELEAHHEHFCERQSKLAKVMCLVAAYPQLPISRVVGHYTNHLEGEWYPGAHPPRTPIQPGAFETRQKILLAAIDQITKGKAVNAIAICGSLGMGRSNIYHYFGSQAKLAEEAYATLFALHLPS